MSYGLKNRPAPGWSGTAVFRLRNGPGPAVWRPGLPRESAPTEPCDPHHVPSALADNAVIGGKPLALADRLSLW